MRRWVAVVVVLSMATVACGGDDDDGEDASTTTELPPVLVHDGFEEGGVTVDRIAPTLDGEPIELVGASSFGLHSVGDVLVAAFKVPGQVANVIASSGDQGETWTTVELPGAQDTELADGEPELARMGGAVVAHAELWAGDGTFLWTTVDGVSWQGGLVPLSPDVRLHPRGGGELPDGRLIIPAVVGNGTSFRMLTSQDEGATWREDACLPPARQEDQTGGCEGPVRVGRGLWLHAQRISLDDGRTWEGPIAVRPAPCGEGPGQNGGDDAGPELSDVVVLADGQWLGSVTDPTRCAGADEVVSNLARSRDGRLWEVVLPNPCAAASGSSSPEGFSPPVPLGDSWLVQVHCTIARGRDRTELYLLDRSGASPRKVATMDAAEASPTSLLHPPVASRDIVIVAEIDLRRTHPLTILHLRPTTD